MVLLVANIVQDRFKRCIDFEFLAKLLPSGDCSLPCNRHAPDGTDIADPTENYRAILDHDVSPLDRETPSQVGSHGEAKNGSGCWVNSDFPISWRSGLEVRLHEIYRHAAEFNVVDRNLLRNVVAKNGKRAVVTLF